MNDEPNEATNHHSAFAWSGASLIANVRVMCEAAVRAGHVDGAAVGLSNPGRTARELLYATDSLAARIDDIHVTLGQGPCVDAYRLRIPQSRAAIGNQHPQSPWPLFDDAVHRAGVRAVFAFPLLRGAGSPLGVLEIYRCTEGPLNGREQAVLSLCAQALSTTIAVDWPRQENGAAAEVVSALPPSPGARIPIAAGMVALQLDLLVDEAFDVLRAHSYSHDRSLTDVADDVVKRRMSFTGGWLT